MQLRLRLLSDKTGVYRATWNWSFNIMIIIMPSNTTVNNNIADTFQRGVTWLEEEI